MSEKKLFDLVIIGAGPAGMTASIYASCYHLSHLIIGESVGGQLLNAPDILNYPGFVNISGKELTARMVSQVESLGGKIIVQSVDKILMSENEKDKQEKVFELLTRDGQDFLAKSVILATGMERRKLNIPGEIEYTGKGVHYCATCEKQDYKGQKCMVVGGANSAVQAAVELAQAASRVYIAYRGKILRGDAVWLEQIRKQKKIEVLYTTEVEKIIGDGEKVTSVKLKKKDENISQDLEIDKVFIEIGGIPGTALVIPLGCEIDKGGYIKINDQMATTVKGVFAAGDMVSYGLSTEQISTSVGLGARAAFSAFSYIKKKKTPTVWGKSQIRR